MTPSYPGLGSASDWLKEVPHALRPIRSTIQIWVVRRRQYGISALVSQTSFLWETVGGVARCRLFSQTNGSITRQKSSIILKISYLHVGQQTSSKFCRKIPIYFHLSVKSAMSTSIFLSTARKKPVEKAIFFAVPYRCQMKKPHWLFCLRYRKTLAIYHFKCHERFLSSFWHNHV